MGKMLSVVVASVEGGLGSLGSAQAAAEQAELEKLKYLVQSANGTSDEAMVRSVLEPMVADINRSNIQRPVCLKSACPEYCSKARAGVASSPF